MTKRDFVRVTTCAAVFGIVGAASFQGVNYVYNNVAVESEADSTEESESATVVQTTSTGSSGTQSVSEVAENVLPSIVAIDVTVTETSSDIFGRTYEEDSEGSGSGIIVGQDSSTIYIVTNNHVVSDATSVTVTFNDESVASAEVKGTDSDTDLAVVSVAIDSLDDKALSNIKVATLGDSDEVNVGDQAIAIGNALGYGTSVTVGYISAKDREVSIEDVTMKLLQTDAAINPGNSGGALVNAAGAVIGINSAKYADESVEGMGFAIPISTAVPIINEIINSENISEDEQGYLGITGTDVSSTYAEYYNMPEGIYVTSVTSGSPAEDGGMVAGDIIVEFDGKTVTTMEGLQEKLSKKKAGTEVEVVVQRANDGEYEEVTLTITLGSKADADSYTSSSDDSDSSTDENDGGYGWFYRQDSNEGSSESDSQKSFLQ